MKNLKRKLYKVGFVFTVCFGLFSFESINNTKNDTSIVSVTVDKSLADKITSGKNIYVKTCQVCHQVTGFGIPGAFPPLAKSDYLNADVNRAITTVLEGKTGEITVNGTIYNSVMTPQVLTDSEVADVLTYVYNSWGNNKTNVAVSAVQKLRK